MSNVTLKDLEKSAKKILSLATALNDACIEHTQQARALGNGKPEGALGGTLYPDRVRDEQIAAVILNLPVLKLKTPEGASLHAVRRSACFNGGARLAGLSAPYVEAHPGIPLGREPDPALKTVFPKGQLT